MNNSKAVKAEAKQALRQIFRSAFLSQKENYRLFLLKNLKLQHVYLIKYYKYKNEFKIDIYKLHLRQQNLFA